MFAEVKDGCLEVYKYELLNMKGRETEMISCSWGIRSIAGAFCQTHTFVQVWLDWHGRGKGERVAPNLFPGGVVLCRVVQIEMCVQLCVFLCVCLSMLNPKSADSTLRSQGPLKWTEPNHCSPPTHTDLYSSSVSQSFRPKQREKNSLIFIGILAQKSFEQTPLDLFTSCATYK